ncbi:MAG: hypothetical protein ACUZ8O_03730 [Candidatus Anammoxibacter sp.]
MKKAGFVNRGGKGSHRNFAHPKVIKPITISGYNGISLFIVICCFHFLSSFAGKSFL